MKMNFEAPLAAPKKNEITPAEKSDLNQATELFGAVINLLPERTPYDLQNKDEYRQLVKSLEDIAQELKFYQEHEG